MTNSSFTISRGSPVVEQRHVSLLKHTLLYAKARKDEARGYMVTAGYWYAEAKRHGRDDAQKRINTLSANVLNLAQTEQARGDHKNAERHFKDAEFLSRQHQQKCTQLAKNIIHTPPPSPHNQGRLAG